MNVYLKLHYEYNISCFYKGWRSAIAAVATSTIGIEAA